MAKVVTYVDDTTLFLVEMGVGPGRANNRDDVTLVQYFLNLWFQHPENARARAVGGASNVLKADGIIGPKTKAKIKAFQNAMISRGKCILSDGCLDRMRFDDDIIVPDNKMSVYGIFCLNLEIKRLYEDELVRLNFREDFPQRLMPMLCKYVIQIGADA